MRDFLIILVFLLSISFGVYTKEKDSTDKIDFTTLSKGKLKALKKEMEGRLKKKTGISFLCLMSDIFCIRGLNRLIKAQLPYMKDMPEYKNIEYIFLGQQNDRYQYKHLKKYLIKYLIKYMPSEENFIEVEPLWQSIEEIREFLKVPLPKDYEEDIIKAMKPIMLDNEINKTLLGPTSTYDRCMNCAKNARIIIPCAKEEKFYDELYKNETVTGTILFGETDNTIIFGDAHFSDKMYNDFVKKLVKSGFKKVKDGKNNITYELDVYYKGVPKKWRLNLIKSKTKCGLFELYCDKKMTEHSRQLIKKFSKSMSTENISIYAGHMRSSMQQADSDYIYMFSQKLKLKMTNSKAGVVFYNSCKSSDVFKTILLSNYKRENYRIISSRDISMLNNMPLDVMNMITAMLEGRCSNEIEAYINRGRTKIVRGSNDPGIRLISGVEKVSTIYNRTFPGAVQIDKIDALPKTDVSSEPK